MPPLGPGPPPEEPGAPAPEGHRRRCGAPGRPPRARGARNVRATVAAAERPGGVGWEGVKGRGGGGEKVIQDKLSTYKEKA